MAQSQPTPGVKKATLIKRPCQEYDIKDLEVSENATIHGCIVQLSPVKVSHVLVMSSHVLVLVLKPFVFIVLNKH